MVKIIEKTLKKLSEDRKQLRQLLGLLMFFDVIYSALLIYGILIFIPRDLITLLKALPEFCILLYPNITLLIVLYILLTRVYPYGEGYKK